MKFEKKVFLDNLDFYMKKKSIKPRELEEAAGVSKGYISRLKKTDNRSVPGVEFLLTVSEKFGITVETLCAINNTLCTDNEKYYVEFLNNLILRTINKKLLWKRIPEKQFIDKIEKKSNEEIIIRRKPSVLAGISETLNGKREYASSFDYGDYVYSNIEGDFYSLLIDDQNTLYMIKVDLVYQEEYFTGIEMFLVGEQKRSNVCCVSPQNPQMYDGVLYRLYDTVKDSVNVNFMDDETQKVIDVFMNKE